MDKITISAKTLDEAIYKAQIELHVTSDRLQYEIVQNASSGVFGIFGAKPCIIRAWEISEEEQRAQKKAEAEKEKAAKEEKKEDAKSEPVKESVKKEAPKKEIPKKDVPKREALKKDSLKKDGLKKDGQKKDSLKQEAAKTESGKKKPETEAENKVSEEKKNPEKKNDRKRGGHKERPNRREENVSEKTSVEKTEESKPAKEEKPKKPVKADPEKVQAAAKNFLVEVFGAMGMTVSIETSLNLEEGELQVMMVGDDMGILIGKRGQTLDSLQYLVSLVVNKETEGYLRVKLDTENYRERRRETLETLARNISYKVKRTKRPVSLEPMNPYERRIIHSALQNDRFVVTRSEGEDPYRHVVISLKNDRYGSGRDRGYASRKERFDKNAETQAEKKMETVEVKAEPSAEASEE